MMTETATKLKLQKGQPTKVHAMCFAIAYAGRKRREDILFFTKLINPSGARFCRTSNSNYFLPRARYDGWMSPVASGLIVKVGHDRKGIIYALSPRGHEVAQAYMQWVEGV